MEGGWNNCRPSKLGNGGNPNYNHQHRLEEALSLGRRSPRGRRRRDGKTLTTGDLDLFILAFRWQVVVLVRSHSPSVASHMNREQIPGWKWWGGSSGSGQSAARGVGLESGGEIRAEPMIPLHIC